MQGIFESRTKTVSDMLSTTHRESQSINSNILTHSARCSKTSWKLILIMVKIEIVAFLRAHTHSKETAGQDSVFLVVISRQIN